MIEVGIKVVRWRKGDKISAGGLYGSGEGQLMRGGS